MTIEGTYRSLALALLDAAEEPESIVHLNRAIIRHLNEYDRLALALVLPHLLFVLAERSDETPRALADEMFKRCPSDDAWREDLRFAMQSLAEDLEDGLDAAA